jgi:hypothetical protein
MEVVVVLRGKAAGAIEDNRVGNLFPVNPEEWRERRDYKYAIPGRERLKAT